MKRLKFLPFVFVLGLVFTACKTEKKETKETTPKITIEKLNNSPAYADAVLQLNSPENTETLQSGTVDFNFDVQNYELGAQTQGPNANLLANSGKGQHIHFILNNQPYSAHYEANFSKEIPNGVHHLVAFLSRSYHESVKNENSVVVKKLVVGENATDSLGLNMDAPTLIYSRPKGTYKGKDAKNLLLDFFVLNTELSENGNKVKATINGNEFLISEWTPHVVKGLPMGEVSISLELIDAEGNLIPGPFNKVERKVTLAKE
ncbi:MAG: hypothetical protein CMB99_01925 [Flavobacteriaceae bacterium]|nr:hypothetical protein [Flavobacteriaceae bacterium]|tara:strand:- start:34014 stop:34796 length:783 start_codon:yes stop_codon:yes gene_type:complete